MLFFLSDEMIVRFKYVREIILHRRYDHLSPWQWGLLSCIWSCPHLRPARGPTESKQTRYKCKRGEKGLAVEPSRRCSVPEWLATWREVFVVTWQDVVLLREVLERIRRITETATALLKWRTASSHKSLVDERAIKAEGSGDDSVWVSNSCPLSTGQRSAK